MFLLIRVLPGIVFFGLIFLSAVVDAQPHRAFGIVYQESETDRVTREELGQLDSAGIRWLLIQEPVSENQRQLVHEADFSLLVMVPEYYPIPYRLTHNSFRYFERSDSLMRFYHQDPAVKGFGLFAYGKWQNTTLTDRLQQLANPYLLDRSLFTLDARPFSDENLRPFDSIVLMTRSADQLHLQLDQNPPLAGVLYAPEDPVLDLRDFQNVLQLLDEHREVPVFFHSNWFMVNSSGENLSPENDLARITRFYSRVPDAHIANPPPQRTVYEINWPMFLLFLFWFVYALYFRLNPLYRRSISRFFFNYDFFVNDVLMRRIRFTNDAAAVFLFSCLMAGIMGFSSAELFLDPVARRTLFHYTPIFSQSQAYPAVFFIIFSIVMAILLGIQIIWLRIANNAHANTSQIATFIVWPQHLNFFVASLGIILLHSFSEALIVIAMLFIFLAITFFSFFATAYNMRRIHPTSALYMATTYALFVLVTTTLISWLVFGLDFIEAWNLAVSLSSLQL